MESFNAKIKALEINLEVRKVDFFLFRLTKLFAYPQLFAPAPFIAPTFRLDHRFCIDSL
jgi:hypothetical protein